MAGVPAQLAPIFQAAGKANGVPASVLAGIAQQETSMGANDPHANIMSYGVPSAGANNPLSPSASIWGAARALKGWGYQQNPSRALAIYNGGPGAPSYSYAAKVTALAHQFAGQFGGAAPAATPPVSRTVTPGGPSVTVSAPGSPLAQAAPGNPGETRGQVLQAYLRATPSSLLGGPGLTAGMVPNTVLSAQKALQTLAGPETLTVHPAAGPAGSRVGSMIHAANSLVGKPYVWGGGHSGWGPSSGYDCSGFVSAVLHAGGYLQAPQTTQTLASQPGIQPGPGKNVTIYDRTDAPAGPTQDHVIIDVNGAWYESGGEPGKWGGGGGVQRIQAPPDSYLSTFNRVLHPEGL